MTTNKSTHSQEVDSPSSPDDAQALSMLYEEFQQPIYSYIYHLLGNTEDAADVTNVSVGKTKSYWINYNCAL